MWLKPGCVSSLENLQLPTGRVHGRDCLAHWKTGQGEDLWSCRFPGKLIVLLNSPPKFHSIVSTSSALSPSSSLLAGGTQTGSAEADDKRVVELPDLSHRKVSRQIDVSSTVPFSSSEVQEIKEDPCPLTIIQKEREGEERQAEPCTHSLNCKIYLHGLKVSGDFKATTLCISAHSGITATTTGQPLLLRAKCYFCTKCSWSSALPFPLLAHALYRSYSCWISNIDMPQLIY